MNIRLNVQDLPARLVGLLSLLILILLHRYVSGSENLIYIIALCLSVFLIARSVHNKTLFVFYVFAFTYVLFLYPYFLKGLGITMFYNFNYRPYFVKGIFVYAIFLSFLVLFNKKQRTEYIIDRIVFKDSNLLFYLNVTIMILVIMFGKSGESIFTMRYGFNKVEDSTIYEYFPIFYLATIIYSGRNKYKLRFAGFLSLLYCVNGLLLGSRGAPLMIALMYFIFFIEHKISYWQLAVVLFLGLELVFIWGSVRANQAVSFNIGDVIGASMHDRYTVTGSNQTDVFYSAVRLISMADMGIISAGEQVAAFFYFLAAIVVPFSMLPPIANLAKYMTLDYGSLGGGLIFGYFYVWFSYAGVAFIAYYINLVWRRLTTTSNQTILAYCVLAFSSIGGWYVYTPITLFKYCVWGMIYIALMSLIHRAVSPRAVVYE